jgi:predicted RNase H-like nuclease
MALAITASFGIDKLQSIPEKPEFDAKGLPMQMLYYLKKD